MQKRNRQNRISGRQDGSLYSYDSLEQRQLLATLAEAGISQATINYIDNLPWTNEILNDETMQNTLEGIIDTQTAPSDAIVLTSASQLSQISSGGTYLIQGDLTINQTIQVPSNTTIYVDGSIYKQGGFTASNVHNAENRDDAIFEITNSASNIQLIGINNALLHSNPTLNPNQPHATAVIVEGFSSDVLVEGFEIAYVWQGLDAQWGTENIVFQNNHLRDVLKRAIWYLGSDNTVAVHNFIENPGVDGIDFDAFTENAIAYENVVVGAGRWAGFVEEGAQENYFIRGLAVMADLGNPNSGYQMGWADNGTTQGFVDNNPGILTSDNYFIDNIVFRPSFFQDGGDYFAKENAGKGPTYFWANRGFGAGQSSLFDNAEWLNFLPTNGGTNNDINAVELLAQLDLTWNGSDLPAFQESGGLVSIEAENFSQSFDGFGIATGWTWSEVSDADAAGGTALEAGPNLGLNTLDETYGPRLSYQIEFTNTGTYRVFLRTLGNSSLDNSVHVGLNGTPVTTGIGQGMGDDSGQWVWVDDIVDGPSDVEINVPSPGRYSLNIWMREDGTQLDKIVLDQSGATPTGFGPDESPMDPSPIVAGPKISDIRPDFVFVPGGQGIIVDLGDSKEMRIVPSPRVVPELFVERKVNRNSDFSLRDQAFSEFEGSINDGDVGFKESLDRAGSDLRKLVEVN